MARSSDSAPVSIRRVTTHYVHISTPEIPHLSAMDEVVFTFSMGDARDKVVRLHPGQVSALVTAQDKDRY